MIKPGEIFHARHGWLVEKYSILACGIFRTRPPPMAENTVWGDFNQFVVNRSPSAQEALVTSQLSSVASPRPISARVGSPTVSQKSNFIDDCRSFPSGKRKERSHGHFLSVVPVSLFEHRETVVYCVNAASPPFSNPSPLNRVLAS